jgi:hypothetical protein
MTYIRDISITTFFLNQSNNENSLLSPDVRESVHRNTIQKRKSNKMQQFITIFIIPCLYEVRHVSEDTPPIIRSLKLYWQPLIFHTWKVVGRVAGGRCQPHTVPDNVH